MLVGLLAPLPEPDQHEILLEVALLLRQRVQARVLDRHRGLDGERLRALHLVGPEPAVARPLREHRGADRVAVGDERQRHQRADAEGAHVVGVDLRSH